ncbi:MAG: acyloxyacyl hydrolase [Rhodobacteraceae bacterium]|nr:MAG: acyloxyacyl hydrolase [Paracoccaceae bacterium]
MISIRLLLIAGLCLAKPAFAEAPRLIGSLGQQLSVAEPEAYLRYMGQPFFRNLQPVLGLSVASDRSAWVGAGSALTWRPGDGPAFVRITSMAGLHRNGQGRDLGGPIQFRTALDFGLARPGGFEFGIGVDHRSSARIYRPNPGLNTAYFFASVPLD